MADEVVEISGHIIDSLTLAKIMDLVIAAGGDYEVLDVEIGKRSTDVSNARLKVSADTPEMLESILVELHVHGANPVSIGDVDLATCEQDGVLPAGFYSTTNLPTSIFLDGQRVDVDNPEMDCGIVVSDHQARTVPMHRVKSGDQVVVGDVGVLVKAFERSRKAQTFEFMGSQASSEKPKSLVVGMVADRVRNAHQEGGKVLVVCGPAIIHTGAGRPLAQLVRDGWVDVLFGGNGFATHDIESNVLGTSLGVGVQHGELTEGGHSNHVRVINEVRRYGSIPAAIEAGYIDGGVMYECVKKKVPYVLAGSVRDDGPLPDVFTDVVEAADAMRYLVQGVQVGLFLASTLHGIATGNLLPASVETFCIDINPAVVTKLTDRGSHQALGVVTDVGLFLDGLVAQLAKAPRS